MIQSRSKLFYGTLIAVSVLLLLLFAVSAAGAEGQGVATEFEVIDVACTVTAEGDFIGFIIPFDPNGEVPLLTGSTFVDFTFPPNGKLLIEATYSPDAFDGTWEIRGQGQETPAGLTVKHTGYGTGELAGRRIQYKTMGIVDLSEDRNPCDGPPQGPPVKLVGKIIEPPGRLP